MDSEMHGNLLNGVASDTVLYRYVSWRRCCELFHKKQIVLVRPSKWSDPFEDFISKTTFVQSGERGGFNLTKEYVGQCWTIIPECDGLWRNYCGLDNGVRVSTTAGKLLEAMWDSTDKYAGLHTFVGRVSYLSESQVKGSVEGCLQYGHELTSSDGKGVAATLLVKRTGFSYENEVRVLAAQMDLTEDIKVINIDPSSLIDSVMFSPKMSKARVGRMRNYLGACGVSPNKLSRSNLYDPWTLQLSPKL